MRTRRHPLLRPVRKAVGSIVLAGVLLGLGAVVADPAVAQPGELEPATIRSRSGEAITGGGSATEFTIDLPDGAECPGDSYNDDYRVGSFMIPAEESPFGIAWTADGPGPNAYGDHDTFRQPLYDDLTASYSSKGLANNEGPGQPGQILDLPAFTFDVYEPGMVPPGRYRIGIVCNLYAEVTTAWGAEIEVVADPRDVPARFTWNLLVGEASTSPDQGSVVLWVVALGGLAVVVVAWLLVRVRRHHATPTSPSPTKGFR